MPSFSFLKLPFLAQIEVLKVMEEVDLLVFSFISKRSKTLAIRAKRTIEKFELDLDGTLDLKYSLGQTFEIPMAKNLREAKKSEKLEYWKVNGQLVPMYRTIGTNCTYWCMGDPKQSKKKNYELMAQYSNHILEVFRCQNFYVEISDWGPIRDLFVFQHTRQLKTFSYCDSERPMRADSLKFILEELEVEDLHLVPKAAANFQWNGPLRMVSLNAYSAGWLTIEALMNSECSYMELDEHCFTEEEINQFIKKWLDGGLPNLEYCCLMTDYNDEENGDVVLQGIQTMPWSTDNHPASHPRDDSGLSDGVDIRRSDGVFATVEIDVEEDLWHHVTLAVWKN